MKYDDEATVEFVDKLFERITNIIYDYSTELADGEGPGAGLRGGEAPGAALHPEARPEGQGQDQGAGDQELCAHDGAPGRALAPSSRVLQRGRAGLRALLHEEEQVAERGRVQGLPPAREGLHAGLHGSPTRTQLPVVLRDRPPDQARDEGEDAGRDPEAHRHRHLQHGQPRPRTSPRRRSRRSTSSRGSSGARASPSTGRAAGRASSRRPTWTRRRRRATARTSRSRRRPRPSRGPRS